MVDPARAQATLRDLKAATGPKNHVVFGYADILELHPHVTVRRIQHVEYLEGPHNVDARRIQRHEDLRLLQMFGRFRVGLDHADHDLAARIARARGPVLFTVDDPLIAFECCGGTDVRGIRGRYVGLGHTKA